MPKNTLRLWYFREFYKKTCVAWRYCTVSYDHVHFAGNSVWSFSLLLFVREWVVNETGENLRKQTQCGIGKEVFDDKSVIPNYIWWDNWCLQRQKARIEIWYSKFVALGSSLVFSCIGKLARKYNRDLSNFVLCARVVLKYSVYSEIIIFLPRVNVNYKGSQFSKLSIYLPSSTVAGILKQSFKYYCWDIFKAYSCHSRRCPPHRGRGCQCHHHPCIHMIHQSRKSQ